MKDRCENGHNAVSEHNNANTTYKSNHQVNRFYSYFKIQQNLRLQNQFANIVIRFQWYMIVLFAPCSV